MFELIDECASLYNLKLVNNSWGTMATTDNLYSAEVDLEKMNVDELVQRLEAMEKNNE